MSKSTDHWSRWLGASNKPAYLSIADLIADDIKSGRLAARDRLPPLRTLADDLGLNYTTVARAYAEARKRGLIDGSPGRGTYIRPANPATPLRTGGLGGGVEMTMNLPPEPQDESLRARLAEGVAGVSAQIASDPYALLRYQEFGGSALDREAAAQWLAPLLPDLGPERVLVSPGIQSTLMLLMGQLVRPGELMCAEALTYPGVKAIATQLGIRLHALPLDDEGPDAQAFELACKSLNPRALYLNPTLQNPTAATISRARREELADVALRYSIPIIEDDAYARLPEDAPPPLATLAPELSYYLTGFSKCLGAGLRVAYVTAPDARKAQRLAGSLRGATVMASPLTTALATRWVGDGTALAMLDATRRESVARQQLAAEFLPEGSYDAHPQGFHLWLRLPRPWSGVEFASHLRSLGVGVVASPAFCIDGRPPEAVRVCLGGPASADECAHALGLIADVLTHPPSVHAAVM